jgi:hypothetical protein
MFAKMELLKDGLNSFYKQLTTPVTIRIPNDVLDYYKSTAKNSETATLERLIIVFIMLWKKTARKIG